ncbi:minor capsid protein [Jeotgalibaca porci]|uniref:minor capsid protein n=1 Tax=Jeotgalibaca porci TaxID=1868793 RepID=UPI00359F5E74
MVVTGEGKSNVEYWKLRDEELKNIVKEIKDDEAYKKKLTTLYNTTMADIQKDIDADILRYANKENLSLAEAKKKISKFDVEAFADKAAKYTKEKDFSDLATQELRTYNITMRTNRLELLQANVGLNTISLANEEQKMLTARLTETAINEYVRQAGILGESIPDRKTLARIAKSIVDAEFRNVEFSNNIWQNQKELQEGLENVIRRTLINGENPRVGARKLRELVKKEFKLKKYAADRIAITETARVQGSAAKKSFEDYGFDEYTWISEPSACDICKPLDGKVFKLEDMGGSAPSIPRHPFCRCALAAYLSRDDWDKRLKERGL